MTKLQETYLAELVQNKSPVTVFLANGVKLQGAIVDHDTFTVMLKREGHTQLIYKHAISTVMPNHPFEPKVSQL